jgi:hypothetical protein
MVCAAATLAACATLPETRATKAIDPVVQTVTVTRVECPPEIMAAIPAPIAPIDAAIRASRETLDWMAAHFAREALLGARIADARAVCDKAAARP